MNALTVLVAACLLLLATSVRAAEFSGWTPPATGGTVDATGGRQGTAALLIDQPKETTTAPWLSPAEPVTGKYVRASAWMKVQDLYYLDFGFFASAAVEFLDPAGKVLKDYPSGVDVEIIERHHRFKEDAPSGTALKFGEVAAEAMGLTDHVHGREGRTGKRTAQEIGYHAVRTGDNPGEHTIVFGMLGETIELRVAASNRDCYAQGAILAAKWLVGKPAGLYNMQDVLGLK